MSVNLLEVRQYNFEGCVITVKLDRNTKTLSFVEYDNRKAEYVDKQWQFSNRPLSYMNGWLHILKAMQYVIEDCRKTMEQWQDEDIEKMAKILMKENNNE